MADLFKRTPANRIRLILNSNSTQAEIQQWKCKQNDHYNDKQGDRIDGGLPGVLETTTRVYPA